MSTRDILTLSEAHEFLGVSEKTLRNYCKAGKLPFHHEKNLRGVMEYRFRKADLEDFARRRQAFGQRQRPEFPDFREEAQPPKSTSDDHFANVGKSQTQPLYNDFPASSPPEEESWGRQLVRQLQEEVLFLKEQLQERDRQIAAKDRQLERQLERSSSLNEQLASLALGAAGHRPPPGGANA